MDQLDAGEIVQSDWDPTLSVDVYAADDMGVTVATSMWWADLACRWSATAAFLTAVACGAKYLTS